MRISDWSSDVCSSDLTKLFPRWEWTIYRMMHARWTEGNLLRLPIFSDFGIDAAGFEPSRPARPSAQLRYTTPGSYVITKGLSTKVGGYEAIYPVAQALMARSEEHTSELQTLMRISYAV